MTDTGSVSSALPGWLSPALPSSQWSGQQLGRARTPLGKRHIPHWAEARTVGINVAQIEEKMHLIAFTKLTVQSGWGDLHGM